MNFLFNVMVFFCRLGLALYFRLGLMRIWSEYYRKEKNKERVPVRGYSSYSDLAATMKKQVWVADGASELWDAVAHPEHVQWKIDNNIREIGDCDEFAVYECAAISASSFNLLDAPLMMSITWAVEFSYKVDRRVYGHNVCLLKFADGKYRYMDYGEPVGPFDTLEEVRDAVIARYNLTPAVSLGYAIHGPYTLELVTASWK